jgi:hypothetical protein
LKNYIEEFAFNSLKRHPRRNYIPGLKAPLTTEMPCEYEQVDIKLGGPGVECFDRMDFHMAWKLPLHENHPMRGLLEMANANQGSNIPIDAVYRNYGLCERHSCFLDWEMVVSHHSKVLKSPRLGKAKYKEYNFDENSYIHRDYLLGKRRDAAIKEKDGRYSKLTLVVNSVPLKK